MCRFIQSNQVWAVDTAGVSVVRWSVDSSVTSTPIYFTLCWKGRGHMTDFYQLKMSNSYIFFSILMEPIGLLSLSCLLQVDSSVFLIFGNVINSLAWEGTIGPFLCGDWQHAMRKILTTPQTTQLLGRKCSETCWEIVKLYTVNVKGGASPQCGWEVDESELW